MKRKILIVAMPESVHTRRWINQLNGQDWDIYLLSSVDGSDVNWYQGNVKFLAPILLKVIRKLKRYKKNRILDFTIGTLDYLRRLSIRIKKNISPEYYHKKIARFINRIDPDLIHTIETQNAGYLMSDSIKYLNKKNKWWHTNWGSDLFLFGKLDGHKLKIGSLLTQADFYSCECQRDILLAKQHGFKGKFLPVYPNTGGFHQVFLEKLRKESLNTSKRRLIMIKGYQGWAGRSLVALRAAERCADLLNDYEIAIFSNTDAIDVQIAAELLEKNTGIKVTLIPIKTSHNEMLKYFSHARIYIGLSISDAISTSLLESMATGAFPIQSYTSCGNEWIENGDTGYLVPPEDPEEVEKAIRSAILDDALVDNASKKNFNTIIEKAEYNDLKFKTIKSYRNIMNETM